MANCMMSEYLVHNDNLQKTEPNLCSTQENAVTTCMMYAKVETRNGRQNFFCKLSPLNITVLGCSLVLLPARIYYFN